MITPLNGLSNESNENDAFPPTLRNRIYILLILIYYVAVFLLDINGFFYSEALYFVSVFFFGYISRRHIIISALAGLGLIFVASSSWLPVNSGSSEDMSAERTFAAIFLCLGAVLAFIHRSKIVALQRSTAALREAHELVQLGHFQFGLSPDRDLMCSDECLRIVGRENLDDVPVRQVLRRIVHPEDLPHVLRQIGRARGRAGEYDLECRILRPDGEIRHVRSVGHFPLSGENQPLRMTGTLLDVSDWRRAERAKSESEARMRSVLDSVFDALVIVNPQGGIESFSTSTEALFGRSAPEISGTSFGTFFAARDRKSVMPVIEEMGKGHSKNTVVRRGPLTVVRKDGSRIKVELAFSAAGREAGHRLTVFIRDLTESQRLEEELRQAHKMEAIGRLAAGVAHDFNNLLTVIIGNLEIMENKERRGFQAALIQETRETAELGSRLTERLLAIGRRQSPNVKLVDLNATLGEIIELLRRPLGEAIDLQFTADEDVRPVLIDASQLQVAVLNLVLNARDAMPAGGTLVVSVTNVDVRHAGLHHRGIEAGKYVLVSVSDDGIGMPESVRLRVFEPFFTTKEWGKGTGLGLPTVGDFVEQSGGRMTIDSVEGRGTTVRLYLPRGAMQKRVSPASPRDSNSPMPVQRLGILALEDDPPA